MIDDQDLKRVSPWRRLAILLTLAAVIQGCAEVSEPVDDTPAYTIEVPSDFPELPVPEENPLSAAKVSLGRHLFYDTRLSRDLTVSCSSCHIQRHAFSDTVRVSSGVDGGMGTRNAPSLTNVGYLPSLLWEGGVRTLEQQAIVPITHPLEMDLHTDTLLGRLRSEPRYLQLFEEAWGPGEITFELVTRSIASFERTLVSGNSPWDRWNRGDASALSEEAVRGRNLFFSERADCFHCHISYNLTDNIFHNNGLAETEDLGRYAVTGYRLDRGRFKTPTLRNIEVTGPYMHDGRFSTLREVVDFYNNGGEGNELADPLIRELHLTDQEVDDLVAFLRSLTDDEFLSDTSHRDPWQ